MITFEEARDIVADNRASAYPLEADFQVAPWGWENEEFYQVLAGSYAEVYGRRNAADDEFIYVDDGPFITVNKTTGEYIETWGLDEEGLPPMLPGAVPVGTPRTE
ncbi:hypothetical protein SEA_JEEVES_3 [Mycobacterium phage Jeeves]|uniref:Uncharacterized protein n=1 Tax=Mycobacterium phage Jeeves TaxID=2652402 RepID=A0A5J6T298_9CAUD|nr:immunity protein [Mycobacterium phage Jeeves]QFG04479.1 hypothetical protein SEA_JEEVES_3 [Mycobacterium phage Jeeves]